MPTPAFAVGDQTIITPANLKAMRTANANRCRGMSWLSDEFLAIAETLVGRVGLVTHIFPPGHDTTTDFGERCMHMRYDYHTRLREKDAGGEYAIVYPGYFNRETVEVGGSLFGHFRVVNLVTGDETSLYSWPECLEIISNAKEGKLLGSFGVYARAPGL